MVERLLMMEWVVGSIPNDGPIELFLVPASAPISSKGSFICIIPQPG